MLNKFTIQKSFAISAEAGSDKTYTLSRRYINALLGFDYFREDYTKDLSYFEDLKPAKVNQIVTLTYTKAAALEMKSRILEFISKILDKNLAKDDEKQNVLTKIIFDTPNQSSSYFVTTRPIFSNQYSL